MGSNTISARTNTLQPKFIFKLYYRANKTWKLGVRLVNHIVTELPSELERNESVFNGPNFKYAKTLKKLKDILNSLIQFHAIISFHVWTRLEKQLRTRKIKAKTRYGKNKVLPNSSRNSSLVGLSMSWNIIKSKPLLQHNHTNGVFLNHNVCHLQKFLEKTILDYFVRRQNASFVVIIITINMHSFDITKLAPLPTRFSPKQHISINCWGTSVISYVPAYV